MSPNPNSIDSKEAIAAAVAAWQLNGNEYLKDKEWEPGVGNIKRWENREIIRHYFQVDYYGGNSVSPPLIKITNEHRVIADDIINYSKKLIFKVLSADPNSHDYEVVMYQKMNQPELAVNDLGYIASAPFYYYSKTRKENIQKRLNGGKNQHVGAIGGKVALKDFEVIRKQWSNRFQGYTVKGFCDDNLFFFFSTKNLGSIKEGDKINIKGTIKDHMLENETYPMTKLTRVHIENLPEENPNGIGSDSITFSTFI